MAISATNSISTFKVAVLVPVFNHEDAIESTLNHVLPYGYIILLVDDGSNSDCQLKLEQLQTNNLEQVVLERLPFNQGKGSAIRHGLKKLYSLGFTHALQIDADGQHDTADISNIIKLGQEDTSAIISGHPQFANDIPKVRLYGRYLAHLWVWINTMSFVIKDSMCGFRIYPIEPMLQLLKANKCSNRMAFDTEILVRWVWGNGQIKFLKTRVIYPVGGVSQFKIFHDNVLIAWMHTRLFFDILRLLPKVLWGRISG